MFYDKRAMKLRFGDDYIRVFKFSHLFSVVK